MGRVEGVVVRFVSTGRSNAYHGVGAEKNGRNVGREKSIVFN